MKAQEWKEIMDDIPDDWELVFIINKEVANEHPPKQLIAMDDKCVIFNFKKVGGINK